MFCLFDTFIAYMHVSGHATHNHIKLCTVVADIEHVANNGLHTIEARTHTTMRFYVVSTPLASLLCSMISPRVLHACLSHFIILLVPRGDFRIPL